MPSVLPSPNSDGPLLAATVVEVPCPQPTNNKKRKRESERLQARREKERVVGDFILQVYADTKDDFATLTSKCGIQAEETKDTSQVETDLLSWATVFGKFASQDPSEIFDVQDIVASGETASIFNSLVETKEEDLFGGSFVMPSNSTFLMSDIEYMDPLVEHATTISGYNVIVMDPPWDNQSVSRSKKYETLHHSRLSTLPVAEIASPTEGCYVFVWVTNNPQFREFILDELFKSWGAEYWGTWYWLKVTNTYSMVLPLDLPNRKPYEPIIVGYIPPTSTHPPPTPLPSTLPRSQVIFSVPGKHSRKPQLDGIIKHYLKIPETPKAAGEAKEEDEVKQVKAVELFARSLVPGWTSWGNEVLKFQDMVYWKKGDKQPK